MMHFMLSLSAFVWLSATQVKAMRRLLANTDNMVCVDEPNMFANLDTLVQSGPTLSALKAELNAAICPYAGVSTVDCDAAATWIDANPIDAEDVLAQLKEIVDAEIECDDVWSHYMGATGLSAGRSDNTEIKEPLEAAILELGSALVDDAMAIGYLHDAQSAILHQNRFYFALAYLSTNIDILSIIGMTFSEAKEHLQAIDPILKQDYDHTNWYINAQPMWDLINGFLSPPHYDCVHGTYYCRRDLRIDQLDFTL